MEPISTALITIGLKSLGAGKFITAIKLAIAGKKLAGIAVAAKGALFHKGLEEGLNSLQSYINEDGIIIHPNTPSNFSSDLIHSTPDNQFVNYLNSRFQESSLLTFGFSGYSEAALEQANMQGIGQILDTELMDKVKEIYGEDYYVNSISTKVGDSVKGVWLPEDFSGYDNQWREDFLFSAKLDNLESMWKIIDDFHDSESNTLSLHLEDQNLLHTDADVTPSNDPGLQKTLLASTNSDPVNANPTVTDILKNPQISDLEKDEIIGKKVHAQYEALSNDTTFQQNASSLESHISKQIPRYFKENTIHFSGNEKLLELVSHHSNWKELPEQLADISRKVYGTIPEEELTFARISRMMDSLFAISIISQNTTNMQNLDKLISHQSHIIEQWKNDQRDTPSSDEEATQPYSDDSVEEMPLTEDQLKDAVSDGRTEEAIRLLLEHLPKGHALRDEAVLLSGRWNHTVRDFQSGAIDRKEYTLEINRIVMQLISLIRRLFK